ncbi:DCC-interacting protein 13-alpha-like [Penaeus monodon]|uniref:DCC-interacting protein 13-alpha-like n=1 Tax=Penaeus monodon TaxID=6687 RepID=UPI0018A7047B|nr:DCC-interacting protein 13-alpha-like [Penaeus monodon]
MRLLISLSTGLTLCIKFQKFPVNGDADGVVASTLSQFAKHVSEMSSWEHIVATQIADGAVYPLSRFIDTELHEMETMATLYQV